jgi:hypothetical protein
VEDRRLASFSRAEDENGFAEWIKAMHDTRLNEMSNHKFILTNSRISRDFGEFVGPQRFSQSRTALPI